jgi:sugar phosphate isomerase/epimerase
MPSAASPRRTFLKSAVQMAAAGGLLAAEGAGRGLRAADPVSRKGSSRFKFSVAGYSYNRLFRADPPAVTLEQFIEDCSAMDVDGAELTSYYFPDPPTPEYLARVKGLCFRLGLDVSGTAVANDFCHPEGDEREKQIAHVKRWIDHAERLGAGVIRIFSGKPGEGQTESDAHRLAVRGIEVCCDYAGQKGIFLAIENHGGLTTHIDGLLALVRDVQSPWFGVNLDTGNFQAYSAPEECYAEMVRMAPYALNVQMKVMLALAGGKKAECQFRRVAHVLKDAGYRGFIALEYEEDDDPRKVCPDYVKRLREAFS